MPNFTRLDGFTETSAKFLVPPRGTLRPRNLAGYGSKWIEGYCNISDDVRNWECFPDWGGDRLVHLASGLFTPGLWMLLLHRTGEKTHMGSKNVVNSHLTNR